MDRQALWEKCVAFHGHACGGLTIGFQAARYAMELLELDFSAGVPAAVPQGSGNLALATAALQELGYSPSEINAALKGVDPAASTEEMVRHALRAMVMKG